MSTMTNNEDNTTVATKMQPVAATSDDPNAIESKVGIVYFASTDNPGFSGTMKQRYTDFLVNEIAADGSTIHLTDDTAPTVKEYQKKHEASITPDLAVTNTVSDATDTVSDVDNASIKADAGDMPAKTDIDNASTEADADNVSTKAGAEDQPSLDIDSSTENANGEDTKPSVSTDGVKTVDEPSFQLSAADETLLTTYFGVAVKEKILALNEKILAQPDAKGSVLKAFGKISSESIPDRALRGRIHDNIRRIFRSRIDTQTEHGSDRIIFSAMPKPNKAVDLSKGSPHGSNLNGQIKGPMGWDEIGGQFLHFTLYKENKDTMEVVAYLARALGMKSKDFNYSGTKDRRAVTVQRVSVYRRHAKNLERLNSQLRGSRLGNFTHEKHRLDLGDNGGNHFTITLKDCHFQGDEELDIDGKMSLARQVVGQGVTSLEENGFINYFGLQRFGTFAIRTDEVGAFILKGDYKGAVDAILTYNPDSLKYTADGPVSRDEYYRARGIHTFRDTGHAHGAVNDMPRRFSAESALIRHLCTANGQNDYLGALGAIPRNLKTMYVHAYQSYVWNMVASKRWAQYGTKVVMGDLVLVESVKARDKQQEDEVDENGEVVIHPADDDIAIMHDDLYQRARPLTEEEANSGRYTVFDVVLPLPGFDVNYPDNDIGDYYKEVMATEHGGGLDPADMRRSSKDFSLSGSYRTLMAQVSDVSFDVRQYKDDLAQLVESDYDKIKKSKPQAEQISERQFNPFPRKEDSFFYSRFGRGDRGRGGRGGRGGWGSQRGGRDFFSNSHRGGHNFSNDNSEPRSRFAQDVRKEEQPDLPTTYSSFAPPAPSETVSNATMAPPVPSPITPSPVIAANNVAGNNGQAPATGLAAWIAFPTKLQAEDAAMRKKLEEERKNMRPEDYRSPNITATFIERDLETGKPTGRREKAVHKGVGRENEQQKSESEKQESKSTANDGAAKSTSRNHPFGLDGAGDLNDDIGGVSIVNNAPALVVSSTSFGGDGLTSSKDSDAKKEVSETMVDTTVIESPGRKRTSDEISNDAPVTNDSESFKAAKIDSDFDTSKATITDPVVHAETVEEEMPSKVAVILEFSLGTSQYATIALRELCKAGGLKVYKPDHSGASGR